MNYSIFKLFKKLLLFRNLALILMLISVLFLNNYFTSYSENNADISNLHLSPIDVNNGLSQNSAHTFLQDSVGFMWIGTADGLNRYDGNKIEIYRNNPYDSSTISNNFVNCLFGASKSGFWICTDNGLNFYNNKSGKFERYLEGLNIRFTSGVLVDSGMIFLTGSSPTGNLFYRYTIKSKQFSKLQIEVDDKTNRYFRIKKDFKGNIWFLGLKSLLKYKNHNKLYETIRESSSDGSLFFDVETDNKGNLYYLINDGLYQVLELPLKDRLITSSGFIKPFGFIAFNNNKLWFTSLRYSRAAVYDIINGTTKIYNFKSDKSYFDPKLSVNGCGFDKSGIFWVLTDGSGILKTKEAENRFQVLSYQENNRNSLSRNFPKGILYDSKGNLWVTTIFGGLNKYDVSKNKWSIYTQESNQPYKIRFNTGMVIFEDSDGTIWYGGSSHIDTLSKGVGVFKPAMEARACHVIYEDFNNNIWYGSTDNKLIKYDKKSGKQIKLFELVDNYYDLIGDNVYSFTQQSDSIYYIGTDFGFYKFNIFQRKIVRFAFDKSSVNSISNDYVSCIKIDGQSRVWACTRDGLNLFDPKTEKFFRINQLSGLGNSFIYGIVASNDSLFWLSTNRGISRIKFKDTNNFRIRNFTVSDGLPSNEFNTNSYSSSDSGRIFFGGLGGIVHFHPSEIIDNPNLPNVVITKINVFDIDYDTGLNPWSLNELQLNYLDNTVSFEFAALEFTNPEFNNFAYMMEGVDKNWVYSGNQKFARYTNLKPGEYVFRVIASNSDNVWNESGTSLKIIIKPPFWRTNTFYLFLFIFIVSMAIIIYKLKISITKNRNQLLTQEIKERTEEIRAKNELLESQTKEIIQINEALEKRVRERTDELQKANEKLKGLLDEVTESKSESIKSIIKAQEDERARFAKDLHDGAGQFMAFLKFNLSNLKNKIADNEFDSKSFINEQIKLVDEIVKDLRQFAYSLMPPVLERVGLDAAIEELLEMYKSSSNIRIEYYIQARKKALQRYSKIHIYRVVQELLNNAVKHSYCTKIHFQILSYPNNILIIIEDNGIGFDAQTVKYGMGFTNIKSRISLLNGKIDIDSQKNHGTTITIEVPN